MIDLLILRSKVSSFESVWFPVTGENQNFWVRARNAKFRGIIEKLCHECYNPVTQLQSSGIAPSQLVTDLVGAGWSDREILILAIMIDQMPRNALAINYGQFSYADRINVTDNIDDSFALALAENLRSHIVLKSVSDVRIVCFFSMIFRHSNRFDEARDVLLSLKMNEVNKPNPQLPPLAEKFWNETNKRQDALGM